VIEELEPHDEPSAEELSFYYNGNVLVEGRP
jgi:hypothetical protein